MEAPSIFSFLAFLIYIIYTSKILISRNSYTSKNLLFLTHRIYVFRFLKKIFLQDVPML